MIRRRQTIAFLLVLCIGTMILAPYSIVPARHSAPNVIKDFQVAQSYWYDYSWHYRRNIPITGSVGAGTGYQVFLNVTWTANMQSDFDDLLFIDSDDSTPLSYWIESYTNESFALVWVKVLDDLDSNQTMNMYYGNAGASSASNGIDTFLFFDDFNDGSLDTTNWHEEYTTGDPSESGGVLTYTNPSGWGSWGTNERWGAGIALGGLVNTSAESNYFWYGLDERTYDGSTLGAGVDQATVVYDGSKKYLANVQGTPHTNSRTTLYTSYIVSEIQWTTDVEFYESHSLVSTLAYLPEDTMGIQMLINGANDLNLDWVYVRNCTDTEPVVGTFGTEENNINARPWPNGEWIQNSEPILTETGGTNEPQVIYDTDPQILTTETYVWKMWYRVGWSTVSIYYAESTNGINWTKYESNPVLDETNNHYCPFILKHEGVYYLYAGYGPWQGDTLYNSSDGISWSIMNSGDPVIEVGTGSDWDSYAIGNVAVLVNSSGVWNMIYEAYAVGSYWKLGLATSIDGINWVKYGNNPVLSSTGASGGPSIIYLYDTYYMFFHGAVSGGLPTEIYMSTSTDLIHWTEREHILARVYDWEGVGSGVGQVADPDVIIVEGEIIMYYAGVTAQSLGNQKIGYARFVSDAEIYQELLIPWTILLGFIMIPSSTLYLVRGGKDGLSSDKLFYFLIIFFIGWALLLGGIMP